MIAIRPVSRFKAAAIHLSISAAIAAAVLAIMLALWYPPSLFWGMGGMELIVLIVGVDVGIGPLITLIIFDTKKKELLFDLTVVAVLQLAALSYGVYALHAGRPVFIVFTGQNLAVASAADIDPEELAKAGVEDFRHLSLTGPRLAAAIPPRDRKELSDLLFASQQGFGIHQLPRYFVPYAERRAQILEAARPLKEFAAEGADAQKLQKYLQGSGKKTDNLGFLPVITRHARLLGIIDSRNGDLLEILQIDPGGNQ